MPNYYGMYKTTNNTWRETGPHSNYELAEQNAKFFANDREFKVISEEEFKLLKMGGISAT